MVLITYSEKFLDHSQGYLHPECKERLLSILKSIEQLDEEKKEKIKFVKFEPIDEKELLLVHEKEYINKLKEYSKKGMFFPDNYFNENTFEISKITAA
ncbi:MAG: hypothetical protein QXI58_07430, partial [Candidatus Micrarchaeia archaeon]